MSDREALLRAVIEAPDDDLPRLVFADWLAEQDDEADRARAEFIRVQIAFARLADQDSDEADRLYDREGQLYEAYKDRWDREARRRFTMWEYQRGFIEKAGVFTNRLDHYLPDILQLTPFRHLELCGHLENPRDPEDEEESYAEEWVPALVGLPAASRLLGLDVRDCGVGESEIEIVCGSPRLAGLTALDVSRTEYFDLDIVFKSSHLTQLERIGLGDNGFDDDDIFKLTVARPRRLRNLRELDLQLNQITDEGAHALLACRHLEGLERLDLSGNQIEEAAEELRLRFGDRVVL